MRDKIKLESTAGTGHFYTTLKNKKNNPDRMERSKYCSFDKKHTPHKEKK